MGTVGVTPAVKAGMIERMIGRLGVQPPEQPGLDTMGCIQAAARGEVTDVRTLDVDTYDHHIVARLVGA